MVNSTMNGVPYPVARFATTLRRQLYKGNILLSLYRLCSDSHCWGLEHLGLIPPQECYSRNPTVTNEMRPAPHPPSNMTHSTEDRLVADPFQADQLWKETARKNREIYTELFHPVPSNLVQNAAAYDVCIAHFFIIYRRLH